MGQGDFNVLSGMDCSMALTARCTVARLFRVYACSDIPKVCRRAHARARKALRNVSSHPEGVMTA